MVLLVLVPESDSWYVLRVTRHSSARLSVVEDWELVHSDRAEIVSSNEVLSVSRGIDCVDIGTIAALREHTGNFPTELTGGGLPDGWVNQGGHTVWNLLGLFDIVEDLGISLIDSSEELGVSGPIHSNNGRGVDESNGPVEGVSSLLADLVDVNGVIVRSEGQVLLVWGVSEALAPFSRLHQTGDSLREVIVVQDRHITIVVGNCNVVPSWRVSDTSGLLVSWGGGHGSGGRLDLLGLIRLSAEEVVGPNLSLLDHLPVLDGILVDGVVVSASQECTFVFENFKSPSLSIEVGDVDELLVSSISVHHLDSSVVMSNKDSAVQNIDGGGVVVDIKRDLSNELVFTLVAGEDGEHIVLSSGNKGTLGASNSGDFSGMGLQDESKILLLIPNVDTSVGTTGVANTILVESGAGELSLGELGSEGSVLEELLAGISWVPELERSGGDSHELEVVWLL